MILLCYVTFVGLSVACLVRRIRRVCQGILRLGKAARRAVVLVKDGFILLASLAIKMANDIYTAYKSVVWWVRTMVRITKKVYAYLRFAILLSYRLIRIIVSVSQFFLQVVYKFSHLGFIQLMTVTHRQSKAKTHRKINSSINHSKMIFNVGKKLVKTNKRHAKVFLRFLINVGGKKHRHCTYRLFPSFLKQLNKAAFRKSKLSAKKCATKAKSLYYLGPLAKEKLLYFLYKSWQPCLKQIIQNSSKHNQIIVKVGKRIICSRSCRRPAAIFLFVRTACRRRLQSFGEGSSDLGGATWSNGLAFLNSCRLNSSQSPAHSHKIFSYFSLNYFTFIYVFYYFILPYQRKTVLLEV